MKMGELTRIQKMLNALPHWSFGAFYFYSFSKSSLTAPDALISFLILAIIPNLYLE
jgi:hypothetical protein